MYRHNEVGHTQCDLSVTPVQHKPPPQCSRFSDHHSLCVCSCLIFHPWPLLLFSCAPSENSPFRWPIQHLLHLHCGKHFLLFQIFSQSCFGWKPGAPAGGHQLGTAAGSILCYSGITSHCVRPTGLCVAEEETGTLKPTETSATGQWAGTEMAQKVCRYQTSPAAHSHYFVQKVSKSWLSF